MFVVQYVIESYCWYKLLLFVSESTDAPLHSTCVYVCVCVYIYVCMYVCVVFNMAITTISATDVKSWLREPQSKNETQILTILSLLCLPKKKQINGINSGVVCSLLKVLNASNYNQSQMFWKLSLCASQYKRFVRPKLRHQYCTQYLD